MWSLLHNSTPISTFQHVMRSLSTQREARIPNDIMQVFLPNHCNLKDSIMVFPLSTSTRTILEISDVLAHYSAKIKTIIWTIRWPTMHLPREHGGKPCPKSSQKRVDGLFADLPKSPRRPLRCLGKRPNLALASSTRLRAAIQIPMQHLKMTHWLLKSGE